MRNIFLITLAFFILLLGSCKHKMDEIPETNPTTIIGFNQNWSFLPAMNQKMLSNISMLKPEMIRYPGGTVTHNWDWMTGIKIGGSSSVSHPVSDIKTLVDATHVKVIFDLDILTRTVDDQILMLTTIQNLGIPIEYIELGNELYANDTSYIATFPTGAEYAEKASLWTKKIKEKFPKVKVAALLQSRTSSANNPRLSQWNSLVVSGSISFVDAYTYHVYIPPTGTYTSRINEFETVLRNTPTEDKELWITEYGIQQPDTTPGYYGTLDSLASFIEKYPKVTIALNHNIIGLAMNKLTSDGSDFTQEGQLFLLRARDR
ncbi:MAG: hypothetical protein ABI237_05800 [Ginsengibacter sp.]